MSEKRDLAQRIDAASRAPGRDGSEPTETKTRGEGESLLLFRASGRHLALRLTDVAELLVPTSMIVTPLPNLRLPFLGVTRRLGKVLPLADLGLLTGADRAEGEESRRYMICNHPQGLIGFAVGEILGIYEFGAEGFRSLAAGNWSDVGGLVSAVVAHDDEEHALLDVSALWRTLRNLVPARESMKWQ